MKNPLIITLGNSEIQFDKNKLQDFILEKEEKNTVLAKDGIKINVKKNRNYEDYLIPVSSRNDGKIILDNYDKFKPIILYPLINPLLDFLEKTNKKFDGIIWVYTDQEDKKFQNSDTVYYAQIFEKWIKERYGEYLQQEKTGVEKNVKDIDIQYQEFNSIINKLIGETSEIENIYLFAQGGIDQINHALTLQLLQKYKDKVQLLQKAEKEETKELQFPKLFLRDLTKQKVIKHIEDYEFGKAADVMLANDWKTKLCIYADKRLNLNHSEIKNFNTTNIPIDLGNEIEKMEPLLNTLELKIQDYIYSYLFDIKNKRFNIAIQKLYSIYENLYRSIVDKEFNYDTMTFWEKKYNSKNNKEKNVRWITFLTEKLGIEFIDYLNRKDVQYNNPNTKTYFRILKFYYSKKKPLIPLKEKEFNKFDGVFNRFRDIRNNIAHKLDNLTEEDFINSFKNPDKNLFHSQLKLISGLDSTKESFYDLLKNRILNNL